MKQVSKNAISLFSTDLFEEAERLEVDQNVPPAKHRATVSLELPECSGIPDEPPLEAFDDDSFLPIYPEEGTKFSQDFHELIKSNRRNSLKRKSANQDSPCFNKM